MAKEEIKKMIDESKKILDSEYDMLAESVRSDLKQFKTKTLDKISKSAS